MGGSAFGAVRAEGKPTLRTPRMNAEQYNSVRSRCVDRLKAYLPDATIIAAPSAPEKKDFGDVDLYLGYGGPEIDWVDLTKALGGSGVILQCADKCSFGMIMDEKERNLTIPRGEVIVYRAHEKADPKSASLTREAYAQIDINLVEPKLINWWGLWASYGDTIGLLGSMSTMAGFHYSPHGFSLRMVEMEHLKEVVVQHKQHQNIHNASGLLYLSCDPDQVLEFMGLSPSRFHDGFDTIEQLFQWLSKCRFLAIRTSLPEVEKNAKAKKKPLFACRELYRSFFGEWLPEHRPKEALTKEYQAAMRQRFAEEAVHFFGEEEEYNARREEIKTSMENAVAAGLLRPLLAAYSGHDEDSSSMKETARAFRRHVGWDFYKRKPYIRTMPCTDAESELYSLLDWADKASLKDAERTSKWVGMNWHLVLDTARNWKLVEEARAKGHDVVTNATVADIPVTDAKAANGKVVNAATVDAEVVWPKAPGSW